MESLIELDKELFLYLNNLGSPNFDAFWLLVTNKFFSIPLYFIFIFLMYRSIGLKNTLISLLVVAVMIAMTDQISYAVKHSVMRLRPCREPSLSGLGRFVADCGSYGYFSGHATSSFALAIFLGLIFRKHYKYMFLLLILWAGLISYSRIYVGVHYPGDVLTGALVGALIGLICYKFYRFLILKFFSKSN
ncbi:phosphatase PAP2 family protein [Flavobacterium sp. CS20]|jgi:undecaprenyl-diphosphatase|uniref:phosphatase PAP2 family protein n=1 Tax=Flavobacterium sp. CS20 TaxID=2775246 RepID=UPI003530443A